MADGEAADSVALVRGLLAAAEGCGVDAGRLVRDAEIPGWALSAELPVMLPLRYGRSIWELTEHALETADAPLAMELPVSNDVVTSDLYGETVTLC